MLEQQILFEYKPRINYKVTDESASSVNWSYSRRNLFETCLLQYYYNYYGASKKITPNEPLKNQLHFLKQIKSIKMRAGEVLHLALRTYLKRQKQNIRMSALGLSGWAQKIFRGDLMFSTEFQEDRTLKPSKRLILLSEFYHDEPDAAHLWEDANQSLINAITNFMQSPVLEDFRLGAVADPDPVIEKRLFMKVGQRSVSGQIDLAFSASQRTKVVDWKSGFSDGSEDSLQLFFYALLMNENYAISPNLIDIQKVYLETEEVQTYQVDEGGLIRARNRIIQDIDRMQSLDRYGRNAVSRAFTPCEQPLICRMCPFRTVCPSNSSEENWLND